MRSLSLGLCFAFLVGCGGGDSFPSDLRADLQTIVDENLVLVGSPGITVAVSIPGTGHVELAAGVRSVQTLDPMRPDDRQRVGSITKAFTVATLLSLENEGLVSLDDPANQWVTGLGLPDTITLRQLLDHTAGLFNYTDDVSFVDHISEPWTPEQVIAWALDTQMQGHGYLFAPGTGYRYSNTNYLVAGLSIEAISGAPFHEAVRARTIDRVGLRTIGLDGFEVTHADYVDGHQGYDTVVTDRMQPAWGWAAGGMVSSARDLCVWAEALYRGDVLPADDRASLVAITPQSIASGIDLYGLGTMQVTRGGRTVFGHTGSTDGFRAEVFIELDSGICVAVLANDFFSAPKSVSEPIWQALAGY